MAVVTHLLIYIKKKKSPKAAAKHIMYDKTDTNVID